jgi:hypothetical protein
MPGQMHCTIKKKNLWSFCNINFVNTVINKLKEGYVCGSVILLS